MIGTSFCMGHAHFIILMVKGVKVQIKPTLVQHLGRNAHHMESHWSMRGKQMLKYINEHAQGATYIYNTEMQRVKG